MSWLPRWLVCLALIGQIGGGLVVPRDARAAPLGVICHAGTDRPAPPAGQHHRHDCAVCPLCAAAALPTPLLAAAPSLPSRSVARIRAGRRRPPARAPPPRRLAVQPRGPPS